MEETTDTIKIKELKKANRMLKQEIKKLKKEIKELEEANDLGYLDEDRHHSKWGESY